MSMKVHIDRFCVKIKPLPESYGSISFIAWKCMTKFPVHSNIMKYFRMSILSIYCIHRMAVLLRPMDSYARAFWANLRIKNFLHLCFRTSDHLKILKLTNQVRMDRNSIRMIFTSIATPIHSTGTSIYTFIHSSGILDYTKSLIIRFLAFSSLLVRASQSSWQLRFS